MPITKRSARSTATTRLQDDDNRRPLTAFPAHIPRETGLMLFVTQDKHAELRQAFLDEEVFPNEFSVINERMGGSTMVHLAVQTKKIEVLRVLLEFGCDPNVPEKNMHYSPIFFCGIAHDDQVAERCEMAKLLIEYGADIYHRDKMDGTVIDRSMQILQQKGGDNQLLAIFKQAAIDQANREDKEEEDKQKNCDGDVQKPDEKQQAQNNRNVLDPNMTENSFVSSNVVIGSNVTIGNNVVVDNRLAQQQQNNNNNNAKSALENAYFHFPKTAVPSHSAVTGQKRSKRTQMINPVTILAAVSQNKVEELMNFDEFVDAEILDEGHQGMPFLYYAATTSSLDAMKWLLDHGANCNYRGPRGETALHQAIIAGAKPAARELIDRNSDLSLKAYDNKSAYSLANRAYNFDDIANLILDKLTSGALKEKSQIPDFVLSLIKSQNTRLIRVLFDCQVISAELLKEYHPNLNIHYIHFACQEGKPDALRELLELVKGIVDLQNGIGDTPCHVAIKHRQLACVQVLIDANANLEIRNGSGATVTDAAIRSRDNAIIKVVENAWKKFVKSGRSSNSGSGNSGMYNNNYNANNNNNNLSGSDSNNNYDDFGGGGGMGAPANSSMMVQSSLSVVLDDLTLAYLSRFPRNFIFDVTDVELQQHIATGGGGSVHLARVRSLDRLVAAKVFRDTDSIQKAIEECERAIRFHHKNIVQTIGLTVAKSQFSTDLVLLMELGEGTLQDAIRNGQGPTSFSFDTVASYMKQVAEGLMYLHEKNLLWLDAKPGNLLLFENRSKIKLCDFGLGREISRDKTHDTVSRAGAGTLKYMSKQQLNEEEVRKTDDIYSYGATFFALVCGVEPWQGSSMPQIMSGNLVDHLEPRQDCPPTLVNVLRMCLAIEPKDRPQNGRELLRLLVPEDEMPRMGSSMPTTNSGSGMYGNNNNQQQQESGEGSNDMTEQINMDMTF